MSIKEQVLRWFKKEELTGIKVQPEKTILYCEDCKYFYKSSVSPGVCKKTDIAAKNYVFKQHTPEYEYCSVSRKYNCGPEAKYFVKKGTLENV